MGKGASGLSHAWPGLFPIVIERLDSFFGKPVEWVAGVDLIIRSRKGENVYKKRRRVLSVVSLSLGLSVAPALAQGSPDQAVMAVVDGLKDARPQVIWEALPTSYQNDVSGVVREFAGQMEDSLWDQTFGTLGKLTRVLDEKRQFVLEHPVVAQQLSESPNAEATYDAVVTLLKTLLSSDISSLERLSHFDGERFLATTGSQVMAQMGDLAALAPDPKETLDEISSLSVTLSRTEGERAWVLIEKADETTEEVEFVLVEEKWIPVRMAEGWDSGIADAREQLVKVDFDPAQTAQAGAMLAMVDGAMEGLLAAQTSEQFQASVQGMVGLAMMGMMGSAAQGSNN